MVRITSSRLWSAVAMAGFLLGAPASSALAATFIVDRTDDTNIAGAQVCSAAANDCSLRGAITKANSVAGTDTITFDSATDGLPFTLSIPGNTEGNNATGDLDINSSLNLFGNGPGLTIIQASTNAAFAGSINDKVIGINQDGLYNSLTVVLFNFTLRWGHNTVPDGDPSFAYTGGGLDIFLTGSGNSIQVNQVNITGNENVNSYGGGVNVDSANGGVSAGTVTFTNVTISGNKSRKWGGGLNLFADVHNVVVQNSLIQGNVTTGLSALNSAQGGGINVRHSFGGTVTIQNSTTISGNTGVDAGGGVSVSPSGNQTLNITDTEISGNSINSGTLGLNSGGGLVNTPSAGTTTLNRVLIANNLAEAVATSRGGGLSNHNGTLLVRNSTVSGNFARADGGGLFSLNGAASTTLTNSTVSANRADHDANASGTGGGIQVTSGSMTLQNTIVDGNFTGTGATVNEISGSVTANFSLIGNVAGATITGANNQSGASARLVALATNGATFGKTYALQAGSPAFDAGSNALATAAGLTTDQRGTGFSRTLDAADPDTSDVTDIGAFEAHPVVEDRVNTAINEDGSLSGTVNFGDSNLTAGLDTIAVTSSNTTLAPNANITLGGSTPPVVNFVNNAPTLVVTPAANLFGTTTITVTATDLHNGTTQVMSDTFVLTVNPVADTPSVTGATTAQNTQTSSGLVISRNAADGAEVTHFKITNILNGTLFQNNGTTPINNNDFITFAQGNAGLKFTATTVNGSFDVQASLNATNGGLGGGLATAVITVTSPLEPAPSVTSAVTTMNTQTTSGLVITTGSGTTTHFKITAITNGTLFQNNGTTQIVDDDYITLAEGNAGLKFTPTPLFTGNASFAVAADNGNPGTKLGPTTTAQVVVASAIAAGDLVIREFRLRGPAGIHDEYIEIANKTASTLTIGALDGSAGFGIAAQNAGVCPGGSTQLLTSIPNGTLIPVGGFFLAANNTAVTGYSLGAYGGAGAASPNATWTADLCDGSGVGLFRSSTTLTGGGGGTVLDAAGFVGSTSPYLEGTGITVSGATAASQVAYLREARGGVVQDTGVNSADFFLGDTNAGAFPPVTARLAAPGPQNAMSERATGLTFTLADPTKGPTTFPNRYRVGVGSTGTYFFRWRVTNNTSAAITSLRIRVSDLTTLNSPGYVAAGAQADFRLANSLDVGISVPGAVTALGLALETAPPLLPLKGGYNASARVSLVTLPGGTLAIGASVYLNVAMEYAQAGNYRYFVSGEAK